MTIEIKLTKGKVALIDDIDADLAELKWQASATHGGYYAVRHLARPSKTLLLHRTILERMTGRTLTKTELTDHINGDKLDNRRTNLRIATPTQNLQNRGKTKQNKSGYKGVSWYRAMGKWRAQITVNGKKTYLGTFATPEEAYAAYAAAAAEKLHGEFANIGDSE
jgi:hypothetical protein